MPPTLSQTLSVAPKPKRKSETDQQEVRGEKVNSEGSCQTGFQTFKDRQSVGKELKQYMEMHNIEPLPISKPDNPDYVLNNREILITGSERAYGNKRRRIDAWGNKVRNGDC